DDRCERGNLRKSLDRGDARALDAHAAGGELALAQEPPRVLDRLLHLRARERIPRRLRAPWDATWLRCGASEYSSANTRRRRALPRRVPRALGWRGILSQALGLDAVVRTAGRLLLALHVPQGVGAVHALAHHQVRGELARTDQPVRRVEDEHALCGE